MALLPAMPRVVKLRRATGKRGPRGRVILPRGMEKFRQAGRDINMTAPAAPGEKPMSMSSRASAVRQPPAAKAMRRGRSSPYNNPLRADNQK